MSEDKRSISNEKLLNFGSEELLVSSKSPESAKKDIESLEIHARYKKQIITGHIYTKKDDLSVGEKRTERDFFIICALIKAEYNYKTIRSIFLNKHLGCSERIREKGEATLEKDVLHALNIVSMERLKDKTPEQKAVALIKKTRKISLEEKLRLVSDYILENSLTGDEPAGRGFRDDEKDIIYYFHKEDKALMDIDEMHIAGDFYYFIRDRYGITRKDYCEVRDKIATEIRRRGDKITAQKFSYYDDKNHILYVSNHDNQIYKLDGKNIKIVENGTDGVFFEFTPEFTPFNVDLDKLKAINYFEKGFTPMIFNGKNSYLRQYLIDKTNFAYEEKKDLTVENQKDLLVIYFYSLFFESLLTDKPIVCFIGRKASGKSTVSALIGKILFGSKYSNQSLPDNVRDLATVLGDSHYIIFDNVDHYVSKDILDIICASIEGTSAKKRMLFTDREIVRITPHVFMGFTTREARFKRDDLVSRLILLNTQKIEEVIPKRELYKDIEENRDKIMTEVLVNLNSIVALLNKQKDYKPRCISRMADWEAFGKKVNRWFHWASYFRSIMEALASEKDKFALEDDPLAFLLKKRVIDDRKDIVDLSASELYLKLKEEAEALKMIDFTRMYRSPISIGKRLKNIQDELNRVFDFEIRKGRANVTLYTFWSKSSEEEEKPEEEEKKEETGKKEAKETTKVESKVEKKKPKKKKTSREIKREIAAIRRKHGAE